MGRKPNFERITKGAIAGLVAGLVASWAANQFHSLWSHFTGDEQNPEVARLSDRGGRPDTAAAKEKVASGGPPVCESFVMLEAPTRLEPNPQLSVRTRSTGNPV
jgi:hypothetical protein